MRTSIVTALAVFFLLPTAEATPLQVEHGIVKVGVSKVISVKLAAQQPAGEAKRAVVVTLAAKYGKCGRGATFSYLEGTWDEIDYFSYWSADAADCPASVTVELQHQLTLDVGRAYKFIFRGARKFDQKVGFRVDKDKVASLLVRKILQR